MKFSSTVLSLLLLASCRFSAADVDGYEDEDEDAARGRALRPGGVPKGKTPKAGHLTSKTSKKRKKSKSSADGETNCLLGLNITIFGNFVNDVDLLPSPTAFCNSMTSCPNDDFLPSPTAFCSAALELFKSAALELFNNTVNTFEQDDTLLARSVSETCTGFTGEGCTPCELIQGVIIAAGADLSFKDLQDLNCFRKICCLN